MDNERGFMLSHPDEGGPRGCMTSEIETVAGLCNLVFRSTTGDMQREYPLLFHPDNSSRLRTVWENGQVICHAGYVNRDAWILGMPLCTASVGAVCTHPDHRGKGHAGRVMADVEESARAEGCDILLVSGSRSLYQRMGCVPAGRFNTYRLKPPQIDPPGLIRHAVPEDAHALVRLHQTQPVRFERSVDDWLLMLGSGMLMNTRADTWVVERDGEIVAYLGVQRAGNDGIARVREYAGSRTAVWSALGKAAAGASEIEVTQMPGDYDLEVLAGETATRSERAFPGTIKILKPGAFFEKAQALLFERVGEEIANDLTLSTSDAEESVTFDWRRQYLDVEINRLAALVFGPPPGLPGIPMPEDPLGSILRSLFPFPLLWYGYNYI